MLSFLLQACGGNQPTQNDVVGTWKSPDGAILIFDQDETFSGKSLPAEYFTFYTSKSEIDGKKVNGTGKWKLKKGQGFEEISLDFQKMDKKRCAWIIFSNDFRRKRDFRKRASMVSFCMERRRRRRAI
ncbi:MAG: hypothetical protein ACHQD7_04100 [Chitinophagales bacterium]